MVILIQKFLVLLCLDLGCCRVHHDVCALDVYRCPVHTGPVPGSFLAFSSREEDPDDVPHGHITSLVSRATEGLAEVDWR